MQKHSLPTSAFQFSNLKRTKSYHKLLSKGSPGVLSDFVKVESGIIAASCSVATGDVQTYMVIDI